MELIRQQFRNISLDDPFFDSLKEDYTEFEDWFAKKADEEAYVFENEAGKIEGFLYLKKEEGPMDDVDPALPPEKRMKVGTFKINAHGTKLGERFMKKIFDHALKYDVNEVYVTVFPKHKPLIELLMRYGFVEKATKTTSNGTERVLVKKLDSTGSDVLQRYPIVKIGGKAIYLLALYPQWHSRLLPDSILKNEDASILEDVSFTNSIHKVYLAAMEGMEHLSRGDVLLIYRTSDRQGQAQYRSVATSICVVEEYRRLSSFATRDEFMAYCAPYSVFTDDELREFWRDGKYPHVVRFSYNLALPKRVTRGDMADHAGIDKSNRWGFLKISKEQLKKIIERSELDARLVVD